MGDELKTGEVQGYGGLLRITIGGLFLFTLLFLDDGGYEYGDNPLITQPLYSWEWEHWFVVFFFSRILWSGLKAAYRYFRFDVRQYREWKEEERNMN